MTGKQYGTIGLTGVGVFIVALVALHVLDPDLSVVDGYISEYALGDYGWLSRAADVALGAGVIAIALGLGATLAPGKRVTASWILILIAGLGWILSGLFVTDPTDAIETTTTGTIHDTVGYVQLLSVLVSSWMLRGVFARDERYSYRAQAQLWFAVAISATMVATMLLFEVSVGLPQRALVVVVLSWFGFLALNLRTDQTPRNAADQRARP